MESIYAAASFTARIAPRERHYVINATEYLARSNGNRMEACKLAFGELKLPELLETYGKLGFDPGQITEFSSRFSQAYFTLACAAADATDKLEGAAMLGEEAYQISHAAHNEWHRQIHGFYDELDIGSHDERVLLIGSLIARVLNVTGRICNFAMLTPNNLLDNKKNSHAAAL